LEAETRTVSVHQDPVYDNEVEMTASPSNYQTEQEKFWAEEFGDEYTDRNQGQKIAASNTALFSKIISRTTRVNSCLEIGANIGLNLIALQRLIPGLELGAIEINQHAVEQLKRIDGVQVYPQSILEFEPQRKWDFVLSKTVLIHINPDRINNVYDLLYRASQRYICLVEYYNPAPVEVHYRGHSSRLFKRDFAGDMLDRFDDLHMVDYGFVYHRDPNFTQDDVNWFLLEKAQP
jgi:pseudaminic acid biosynthesis-associated methylase